MYSEAIPLFQDTGNSKGELEAQVGLAGVLEIRGEIAAASKLYASILPRVRESGNKAALAELLQKMGRLLLREDRKTDAAVYFRESAALYEEIGNSEKAKSAQDDLSLLNVDYRNRVVMLLQQGYQALNARQLQDCS